MKQRLKAFRDRNLAATLLLLLLSFGASAQVQPSFQKINAYGYEWQRGMFDSALYVPRIATVLSPFQAGAVRYNAADSSLYVWTGFGWRKSSGGGIATNIYTTNGTLTGNRTVDGNGKSLTIDSVSSFAVNVKGAGGVYIQHSQFGVGSAGWYNNIYEGRNALEAFYGGGEVISGINGEEAVMLSDKSPGQGGRGHQLRVGLDSVVIAPAYTSSLPTNFKIKKLPTKAPVPTDSLTLIDLNGRLYKTPHYKTSIDSLATALQGSFSIEQITKAQAVALKAAKAFVTGKVYKVTGVDSLLYGGTTIFLKAASTADLEIQGIGEFYVPKYKKSYNGIGIWSADSSYASGRVVFWGGKAWTHNNTTTGTTSDIYALSSDWTAVAFSDTSYYTKQVDLVKYDLDDNRIFERQDAFFNRVSAIPEYMAAIGQNPIKAFQWGNYGTTAEPDKFIVGNTVQSAYCEIINFNGYKFAYNHISDYSSFQGNRFGPYSFIEENVITSSSVDNNNFNNTVIYAGDFSYNVINQNGNVSGNTFTNAGIRQNQFGSSYFASNTFTGGNFVGNTFTGFTNFSSNTFTTSTLNDNQFFNGTFSLSTAVVSKTINYMQFNNSRLFGTVSLTAPVLTNANITRDVFRNNAGTSKLRYTNTNGVVTTSDLDNSNIVYSLNKVNGVAADSTGNVVVSGSGGISDGDKGDITVSGSGATWTIDNATITTAKISATGTPSSTTYLRGDGSWATPAGGSGGGDLNAVTTAGATTTNVITVGGVVLPNSGYPTKLMDFGGTASSAWLTLEGSGGFAFINKVGGTSGFFSSAGAKVFTYNDAGNMLFGSGTVGSTYAVEVTGSNGLGITVGGAYILGETLINTTSDAGDYRLQVTGNFWLNGQITLSAQYTPVNSTDATYNNKTLTADDTYLYYRTSSGTWKKLAWITF